MGYKGNTKKRFLANAKPCFVIMTVFLLIGQ